MSSLFINPFVRPLSILGTILPFGKLYFYLSGTLTEAPVYDEDGDEYDQPILADVTGLFPNVYMDDAIDYRVRLENAAGVEQGDADPWTGIQASGIGTTGGGTVQDALDQRLFNIGLFTGASTKTVPAVATTLVTSGYSVAGKGSASYVYDAAVDASYVAAHPRTSFLTANGRGYRIAETSIGATMVGAMLDFIDHETPATDDTEALQALFDIDLPVYLEEGWAKVTGPLTRASLPIYQMPGSIIVPTGSAYTVLTITNPAGRYSSTYTGPWSIRIMSQVATIAERPTLNGVLWTNPAAQYIEMLTVNSLGGFGARLLTMWDCTVSTISIVGCGDATNYAFSMDAGVDGHCNESTICRLQVEEAQERAISIAGGTLNCNILLVHSERAFSTTFLGLGEETWVLSGNVDYSTVRLGKDALSTVPPRAFVGGQGLTIKLRSEDDIPVRFGWLAGTQMVVHCGTTIAGSLNSAGNLGTVLIDGAVIDEASGDLTGCVFRNCLITALAPQSGFVAEESTVTAYTDHASAAGFWRYCALTGTFTNLAGVHNFVGMHFVGNMLDATGNMSCIFDDATYCSGTVHADYLAAPSGGSWTAGQRTKNLVPTTGQPRGWTLVSGSGWVNEGNF